MDIEPQNTQSISDDQELSKVLAGINPDDEVTTVDELPLTSTTSSPPPLEQVTDMTDVDEPVAPVAPEPVAASSDLSSIKTSALTELRPLVGKLELSPEDKFDTYLLLIRSTDDKSLVQPAYEAAQMISDETQKAKALIEVVKEIDYLNRPTA